jgi:transcriptional regulator with XRE-family HTH domain
MSDESTPPRGRLREYVAEEIRVILARKKMSGVELGRRAGIKQSSMSRRLTGQTAFDMDEIEAIAAVLEVSVADLLPKTVEAGGSLRRPYEYATRSVDPLKARPISGGPFSGGRRDSTRPDSSVPATRRRPQIVSTPRRPKAA